MSNAREAALALIAAVAAGTVEHRHLAALAHAVLDDETARLALEVQAGGAFAVRRAIELAALVVAGATPTSTTLPALVVG